MKTADKFLLMDVSSRKNAARPNEPMFGNSLAEQYKTSSLPSKYRSDEFDDFMRVILRKETAIHISYPNFERGDEPKKDTHENTFYNNVAVRIPGKSKDIVFMGDVVERNTGRGVKRTYTVKGILAMDPNVGHYGEIDERVKIIARMEENRWEGPDDFSADWPTEAMYENNVFSDKLLKKLSKKYVVQDVRQITDMIGKWRKYLDSRKYLYDVNSQKGYDIAGVPEIIRAYSNSIAVDKSKLLDPGMPKTDSYWTAEPESRDRSVSAENLLVRINIEENYKEYEKSREEPVRGKRKKDFKSQIDAFASGSVSVVNPKKI